MKLTRILRQISRFIAGDMHTESRIITQQDCEKFSEITGDHNPIHKFTQNNQKPIVHGAFLNSIVAGIIGTTIPGPGTIVVSQNFEFPSKCFVDEPVKIRVELLDVRKIIKVRYEVTQGSSIVFRGEAEVINKN